MFVEGGGGFRGGGGVLGKGVWFFGENGGGGGGGGGGGLAEEVVGAGSLRVGGGAAEPVFAIFWVRLSFSMPQRRMRRQQAMAMFSTGADSWGVRGSSSASREERRSAKASASSPSRTTVWARMPCRMWKPFREERRLPSGGVGGGSGLRSGARRGFGGRGRGGER